MSKTWMIDSQTFKSPLAPILIYWENKPDFNVWSKNGGSAMSVLQRSQKGSKLHIYQNGKLLLYVFCIEK